MEDVRRAADVEKSDLKPPNTDGAKGRSLDSVAIPSPEMIARRSPLVGRGEELQGLKASVEQAIRGNGSIVFLTGEAGIGKARLPEELREYAAGRGVRFLQGACLGEKEVAPYYPWIELIRGFVRQAPTELFYRVGGGYVREIAKLIPELTMMDGLTPEPRAPVWFGDQGKRVEFFQALTQFFISLCRESPLLLFLDDLHWADASSLQLLHHVARNLQGRSITLLGAYRDSDVERASTLSQLLLDLNREHLLNTIHLARLGISDVARMLSEVLDQRKESRQQTHELRDLIYQRTGGNPFYVEEVLKSLVEQGLIFRTGGRWSRKPISEIQIPTTVKAVIDQRLSRFDDESRNVLMMTSVLGKEFGFELLQRVTGIEEEHLLDIVDRFLKSHLLEEHKVNVGESVYAFADFKVRDLLHEDISLVRRRKYHLKVGEAIEQLYKDRIDGHVSDLAYHFLEGNDQGKSLRYCVKAGESASKVYAHEEAVRQFKIALELLEERDDKSLRSEVLERLGDAENVIGESDAAIRYYGEAAEIHEGRGDRMKAGTLYRKMGWVATMFGKYHFSKSQGYFDKAAVSLESHASSEEAAQLFIALASQYFYTGRFSEGTQTSQKALALAKKLGLYEVESIAYTLLGILAPITENEKLYRYVYKSLDIARTHDLPFATAMAYLDLVSTEWKVDMAKGLQIAEEGRDYARRTGYLFFDAWMGTSQARAFLFKGEPERVREIIDGIEDYVIGNFPTVRFDVAGVLGYLNMRQGDLSESEKKLKEHLPALRDANDWMMLTWNYGGLGDLYIQRGEMSAAEEYLRKGYELFKEIGVLAVWASRFFYLLSLLVEVELKLGKVESAALHVEELWENADLMKEDVGYAYTRLAEGLQDGQRKEWGKAIDSFQKSIDAWERIGWPYEQAKTLYESALAHQGKGDMLQTSESLDRALEIFARLGAKLDVKKVMATKESLWTSQGRAESAAQAPQVEEAPRVQMVANMPSEITAEKEFQFKLDLINTGKAPAILHKIQNIPVERLMIASQEGGGQVNEDGSMDLRGKRLPSLQIEAMTFTAKSNAAGEFDFSPTVSYSSDERGGTTIITNPLAPVHVVIRPSQQFEFSKEKSRDLFECLVSAFVQDYMVKKLHPEESGWRTLVEIARKTRTPTSTIYGGKGGTGPVFGELYERGLVVSRVSLHERGRGGEVTRLRVAYEKEPVREYVNRRVRIKG